MAGALGALKGAQKGDRRSGASSARGGRGGGRGGRGGGRGGGAAGRGNLAGKKAAIEAKMAAAGAPKPGPPETKVTPDGKVKAKVFVLKKRPASKASNSAAASILKARASQGKGKKDAFRPGRKAGAKKAVATPAVPAASTNPGKPKRPGSGGSKGPVRPPSGGSKGPVRGGKIGRGGLFVGSGRVVATAKPAVTTGIKRGSKRIVRGGKAGGNSRRVVKSTTAGGNVGPQDFPAGNVGSKLALLTSKMNEASAVATAASKGPIDVTAPFPEAQKGQGSAVLVSSTPLGGGGGGASAARKKSGSGGVRSKALTKVRAGKPSPAANETVKDVEPPRRGVSGDAGGGNGDSPFLFGANGRLQTGKTPAGKPVAKPAKAQPIGIKMNKQTSSSSLGVETQSAIEAARAKHLAKSSSKVSGTSGNSGASGRKNSEKKGSDKGKKGSLGKQGGRAAAAAAAPKRGKPVIVDDDDDDDGEVLDLTAAGKGKKGSLGKKGGAAAAKKAAVVEEEDEEDYEDEEWWEEFEEEEYWEEEWMEEDDLDELESDDEEESDDDADFVAKQAAKKMGMRSPDMESDASDLVGIDLGGPMGIGVIVPEPSDKGKKSKKKR